MDGETIKMIGRGVMFLSLVVFIVLLWLGRRTRREWSDNMLWEYGEEIYYANRLMRNALHLDRIFPSGLEQGGGDPQQKEES